MKKGVAPLFIIIVIFVIGGAGILSTKFLKKPNTLNQNQTDSLKTEETSANIFRDQTDLCVSLSKETIGSFLGKTIIKTESLTHATLQSCQYFLDDAHALTLNHDYTSIDSKLKGHEFLGRKITSNNNIPMRNYVIIQDNGLINEIYLVFNDTEFISINRPNSKLISEEEIVNFAIKLANFFQNGQSNIKKETSNIAPLPAEEDIIKNFFQLINEKKIPEAISMMSKEIANDDSTKQAWGVHFNAIKSVAVQKIEPSMKENWTDNRHTYKVTLEIYISSDAASAPIPYYGWGDNPNIRWVSITKEDGLWKIAELATGP